MFLLDTNVISDIRKIGGKKENPNLAAWVHRHPASNFYLSAITLFEIELGILRVEGKDQTQAQVLRRWLSDIIIREFQGRILPFDGEAARHCAAFHVPSPMSFRDSFIAAVAAKNHLTLVTRNTKDFAGRGLHLINPYR